MTKSEAVKEFAIEVLPGVVAERGPDDKPALAEAWNNWTDALCQDGRITAKQYATWTHPRFTRSDFLQATVNRRP